MPETTTTATTTATTTRVPSCFGEYGGAQQQLESGSKTMNSVACLYQTKLAGQCRLVTISWCKNLMGQGLYVSVDEGQYCVKVEMRPWRFWKKQGSKSFDLNGHKVVVFWDLSSAKYPSGGPEPQESFYVAIVCEKEVVLLLGDMEKEAYRKIGDAAPSSIEASLVSRREHLFGKKYFTTKVQFCEGGEVHEVMIDCPSAADSSSLSSSSSSMSSSSSSSGSSSSTSSSLSASSGGREPRMCIRVDRKIVVQVKRLAWKFRGNQTIVVDGQPVEVFWDVHNWLFNPSSGHAVFMFQMCSSATDKPWLMQPEAQRLKQQDQAMSADWSSSKMSQGPVGFSLVLNVWKKSE